MKKLITHIIVLFPLLISCAKSSKNEYSTEPENHITDEAPVLIKLCNLPRIFEVDEAYLKTEKVYIIAAEASDSPAYVLNSNCDTILICDFAWGPPDSLCYEFKNTRILWRRAGNSLGLNGVDCCGISDMCN